MPPQRYNSFPDALRAFGATDEEASLTFDALRSYVQLPSSVERAMPGMQPRAYFPVARKTDGSYSVLGHRKTWDEKLLAMHLAKYFSEARLAQLVHCVAMYRTEAVDQLSDLFFFKVALALDGGWAYADGLAWDLHFSSEKAVTTDDILTLIARYATRWGLGYFDFLVQEGQDYAALCSHMEQ